MSSSFSYTFISLPNSGSNFHTSSATMNSLSVIVVIGSWILLPGLSTSSMIVISSLGRMNLLSSPRLIISFEFIGTSVFPPSIESIKSFTFLNSRPVGSSATSLSGTPVSIIAERVFAETFLLPLVELVELVLGSTP